MPVVVAIHARTAEQVIDDHICTPAQSLPLCLPSGLPVCTVCDAHLQQYKWRLCYAQAHDSLDTLCHHLHLQAHIYNFKFRFDHGQIVNIHSNDIISCNYTKVESTASWYQNA